MADTISVFRPNHTRWRGSPLLPKGTTTLPASVYCTRGLATGATQVTSSCFTTTRRTRRLRAADQGHIKGARRGGGGGQWLHCVRLEALQHVHRLTS